ncbi:hypothetical protein MTR67_048030 [Solanum verrucosum]|uniref:Uncharacterized protein n=1 Tax=Solanum verrucosum TaxID=315347 RepID=A0AAF0UYW0_SOLVR|nr:hypothetical protein MTR67_048030 [Solanum verrucosum]
MNWFLCGVAQGPSLGALASVGNIAKAMGPTMEPHVRGLLDLLFFAGFSVTLVDSLELLSESIPPLLPTTHNQLLEMYLSNPFKIPYPMSRQSAALSRGHLATVTPQVPKLSGSAVVQITLQTLAHFNFKGHDFLEKRKGVCCCIFRKLGWSYTEGCCVVLL